MLSAVAARKARLATNPPAASPLTPPSQLSPSPSPELHGRPSKPLSKRKPAEHSAKPPSKRKRQPHTPRNTNDGRARYFQEDAFKEQDDVITVDEDEDEESDASKEQFPVDVLQTRPTVVPVKKKSQARAWSPSAPLPDSTESEDEGDGLDAAAVTPLDLGLAVRPTHVEPEEPSLLSTFWPTLDKNMFHLSSSEISALSLMSFEESTGTALLMSAGETLALLGSYRLTVLQGTVSLAGTPLSASRVSHNIFAPRSSPLPVIQCQQLDPSPAGLELPTRMGESVRGKDAVVLLQELRTDVEGLGRICRTFEGAFGPSRWQGSVASFDLGLQGVHVVTHPSPGTSVYKMPPSWETELNALVEHNEDVNRRHVYLVKGPRNSGKSTFAKVLLNRLLCRYRRVACLECDLGQSEFTPGGMVALNLVDSPVFGPPFTHPSIPYAAHYVGATSPRNSPAHYLDSIQALVQTYNLDVQNAGLLDEDEPHSVDDDRLVDVIPLVVNTMGWTKGLGSNLMTRVQDIVDPSDVYELGVPSPEDPPIRSEAFVKLHAIEAVSDDALSNYYTAMDHRTISMLSYFHAMFPAHARPGALHNTTATSWRTALPLVAQASYGVDWKLAFDRVFLVGAGMEDVVLQEAARALNGAIVGLVSTDPVTLNYERSSVEPHSLPYTQGDPPPSPYTSSCTGLALIRGVSSPPESMLQVLTPLPPATLITSRVLVKGEIELPVWGMLDFRSGDKGDIAGSERDRVPYLRWGKGEGVGAERRRVRRNLMRRGQM